MLKGLMVVALILISGLVHAEEVTGINVEVQAAATPQNSGYSVSETASEYLFLPARGDNSAQFSFSRTSAPFLMTVDDSANGGGAHSTRVASNTNDYSFRFVRNISSATYLSLDLGYQTNAISVEGQDMNSSGLRDFGFGLTGISHNNGWNLVYGSNFTLSPATSVSATSVTDGNRFSGGTAAIPFIGFEAISHSAIWGAKANAMIGTGEAQSVDAANHTAMVEAFYEVPLFPTARVGFVAGGGRDFDLGASSLSTLNTFTGGAYSKISFPKQADLILKIQSTTKSDVDVARNATDASIAFRKTL